MSATLNTDRELWRKGDGDGNGMSYYEPTIHVTEQGLIGINVGGRVYVLPVEDWHRLAAAKHGDLCEWCGEFLSPLTGGSLCRNCLPIHEGDGAA